MAIVWSWMARNFQIILIVEKRPKRWKLFKTLFSEVFDYTKMNFFTMPITCRKGRRHFHICGIKRFDGVFFEILGTTSKHHISNWQKVTKNWVIDWLLTTKVSSVYSGRGSKMMICPTCPSYFTMATQIRIFYHRYSTMSLFTLQISTFLKKCYNWPWQLVLTHNVNAMVGSFSSFSLTDNQTEFCYELSSMFQSLSQRTQSSSNNHWRVR